MATLTDRSKKKPPAFDEARRRLRLIVAWATVALMFSLVPVPAAHAADPSDSQVIGVVGCSNTRQHAGGYGTVSVEDKMWPESAIQRYGGGSLTSWLNNKNDKFFKIFDAAYATHGADTIYVQLCIRAEEASSTGMTATQQAQVTDLLARIRERDANFVIYLSPLNFFSEEDCGATGDFGQPNSVELADWAAEQGLALRGPDTGPLNHDQLAGDLCHLNEEGRAVVGQQLVDFFDNKPPTVTITNPADTSTVSGAVTIMADVFDDYGMDRVDFFADGGLLGTDTEAPFEVSWDTTISYDGPRTVQAVATDNVGKTGSHEITVTVDNGNANTPPLALIADDGGDTISAATGSPVTFDATGSSDAEGTIVSYEWDFGDGATGSGAVVEHTYTAESTYVATLTVTDDGGLTATDTVSVVVTTNAPPTVAITAPADLATVSGIVTITADADDDIGVAQVDFAVDGVPLSTDTAAPYEALWDTTLGYDGDHIITATAVDSTGLTAESSITVTTDNGNVNTPPTAVIVDDGAGNIAGIAGVPITFDGTPSSDAEGSIVSYDWDFGNGDTGTGSLVDYTYTVAGTYPVTLTVTDDGGLTGTTTATATISGDMPPQVTVTNPLNGDTVSGTVTIMVDASDDIGVTNVEIYVDGLLLGSDDTAPYETDWDSSSVYDGFSAITAIATDTTGQTTQDAVVITVDNGNVNTPPIADILDDGNGTIVADIGELITFDGSASFDNEGTIVSYDWDFGDGTAATGAVVDHSYSPAGTYTATLTVTDDGGLTGSDSVTVTINDVAEIEVLADSFENGEWNGLWTEDASGAWFTTSKVAFDGAVSAVVRSTVTDATLTSVPLDLAGKTNATVTFSWYLWPRSGPGDVARFEYSTDQGASWVTAATLDAAVDANSVWNTVTVDISGATDLMIRYRATLISTRTAVSVDDVVVTAS